MKQRIYVNNVKGNEFTASWSDPKLNKFQIEALGIVPSSVGELQVIGDYSLEWNGEIATVYVTSVLAYSEILRKWIAIDEYQIDYEDVAFQLEQDYSNQDNWRMDRESSMIDAAMRDYEDYA